MIDIATETQVFSLISRNANINLILLSTESDLFHNLFALPPPPQHCHCHWNYLNKGSFTIDHNIGIPRRNGLSFFFQHFRSISSLRNNKRKKIVFFFDFLFRKKNTVKGKAYFSFENLQNKTIYFPHRGHNNKRADNSNKRAKILHPR